MVINKLRRYFDMLAARNRDVNLTAITEPREVATLHFLDSLALLPLLAERLAAQEVSVIDVGTGAGFPGLPLAIAEPRLHVTLLDATRKRVDFLGDVARELALTNVSCVHARAEEYAHSLFSANLPLFDVAVSRAVARLNVLAELCLPLVRVGGDFIAMKSADSDAELAEAERAFELLGGEVLRVVDYLVPETEVTHRAIIIRKVAPTPPEYPRRFKKIQTSPL